ncbi:MAG: carbon-nitrogen hydrolase family protein [Fimbriimonas sp.]
MRVASVQAPVVFGDPLANADYAVAQLRELAADGVNLAVFPEAFLTGYCVKTRMDASAIAIPSNHEALTTLQSAVDELGMGVVVGFAENRLHNFFNTAALLLPGAKPQYYRKTHLPELGLDRFVMRGDSLPVFTTPWGQVGILICFDLRPPEAARVLALNGAEVILVPTNWPNGATMAADTLSVARAAENRVYLVSCNRVGEENGFGFIGRSKIVDPLGRILAAAEGDEQVLVHDLDLAVAREKRTVTIPGEYETTVFQSRRPELYGDLTTVHL